MSKSTSVNTIAEILRRRIGAIETYATLGARQGLTALNAQTDAIAAQILDALHIPERLTEAEAATIKSWLDDGILDPDERSALLLAIYRVTETL